MLPGIADYRDLLEKLRFDFKRFVESDSSYAFMDCLLTLNALPEWISGNDTVDLGLKAKANKISKKMSSDQGKFDQSKVGIDINQSLVAVRIICNNVKHAIKDNKISIVHYDQCTFPIIFDAIFGTYIVLGSNKFRGVDFIRMLLNFWELEIAKYELI